MKYIPDCKTDLQNISNDFDEYYVQQWLFEKKTGNQSISFLERGKQLFISNNQVLNLLEQENN